MSRICVVGTGYVGLPTGACFADLGNDVRCVDIDPRKIELLQQGYLSIFEAGLEELVHRNQRAGRLTFTTSYEEGLAGADFVFIAVNTPAGVEGDANMSSFRSAAESIANHLTGPVVIVNKSTVPIGTGEWVTQIVQRVNPNVQFSVVSNPEFTREAQAVHDFMNPDRIVLGSTDRQAADKVAGLYATFKCPIIITDLETAEMIKYASNAFLATRISFINEIAAICDRVGADVKVVAQGMGFDKRIGASYLDAGLGYGGSCFPKDLKALEYMGAIHGCHPQLLRAVMEINRDQRRVVVQRLREILGTLEGRTIGILGLSFKPGTDDVRDAPALEVIRLLQSAGATVKGYDPAAMEYAAMAVPGLQLCKDAYEAADGSDGIVVCVEWNEFRQLDMSRVKDLMSVPVIIDGRNIYEPQTMHELGFIHYGIGRGGLRSPENGDRIAVGASGGRPTLVTRDQE